MKRSHERNREKITVIMILMNLTLECERGREKLFKLQLPTCNSTKITCVSVTAEKKNHLSQKSSQLISFHIQGPHRSQIQKIIIF